MKIEKVLVITFLLIFTLTVFCSTVFSRQGTLTGQVLDGFDNVVKDVEVKIKNTKFTTKTDENGQYRINFNPGKIEISFSKKGYTRQSFHLNLREAAEIQMPNLTFWKLPENGGLFLVRIGDYKKIENVSFYSERDDSGVSFYVKGDSTKINCPDEAFVQGSVELMILDYSKKNPVVVGKSLYRVTDHNLIGNIVYKSGNWSIDDVDDTYSKVSNRVGLHYVKLEPGKYFYCIGEITLRSRIGYGYYFEIAAPGS